MDVDAALERVYRLYNTEQHGAAFIVILDLLASDPADFRVQSVAVTMLKKARDEDSGGLLRRWVEACGFGNLTNAGAILREFFDDPGQLYLISGVVACLAQRLGRPAEAMALFANCLTSNLPDPMGIDEVASKYQDGADVYDDNLLHSRSITDFTDFLRRNLDGASGLEVVDVPCGTGQAGPMLRPLASRLVGCDLSSRMTERAAERGLYDEVLVGDMLDLLPGMAVDMIVSHGSLYYFKDLRPVAAAASAALKSGGRFALTDYPAPEGLMATTGGTLRYCRSPELLRAIMAEQGLGEVASELGVTYGLPCGYWLFRKT